MNTRIRSHMKTIKVMKINNMRTLRNKKTPILFIRAPHHNHITHSRSTRRPRPLSTKNCSKLPIRITKNNQFLSMNNRHRNNQVLILMAPNKWKASILRSNIIRKAQLMPQMRSLSFKRLTKLSTLLKRSQTNMTSFPVPKRTSIS